jgi:hypothetical protein
VNSAGWLEEGLPRRQDLFRLVVDRKPHLTFDDVSENGSRMTMARALLSATGCRVQLDEHHLPALERTAQRMSRQFGWTSRRRRLRGRLRVEGDWQQRRGCHSKKRPTILRSHAFSF